MPGLHDDIQTVDLVTKLAIGLVCSVLFVGSKLAGEH